MITESEYLKSLKVVRDYLFQIEIETGNDKRMEVEIVNLPFSVRTYNCLKYANILTVGDIIQRSKQDLFRIRNFGHRSFSEIEEYLESNNLKLRFN